MPTEFTSGVRGYVFLRTCGEERGDNMTDDILLTIGDDGKATLYDNSYDITIHCDSQEEQDEVKRVLENVPHWIPVTERLPEEETDVLVTVNFLGLKRTHRNGWNEHIKESFYVEVASHINGEWSSASDEYKIAKDRHKVLAWMPLPEPYKGVTDDRF